MGVLTILAYFLYKRQNYLFIKVRATSHITGEGVLLDKREVCCPILEGGVSSCVRESGILLC